MGSILSYFFPSKNKNLENLKLYFTQEDEEYFNLYSTNYIQEGKIFFEEDAYEIIFDN